MISATRPSLEELLDADPAAVARRCGNLYDSTAGHYARQMVLFGAGHCGRAALEGLRRAGIEPIAFADNNPKLWGGAIDDLPVFSCGEVVRWWSTGATFIVTIYNGSAVRKRLIEDGCMSVVPASYLYWKYPDAFLPIGGISRPESTLSRKGEIMAARKLWSDQASLDVFDSQIAWRLSLDYSLLPPASPASETYFIPEIEPMGEELFVDCGAFDGDSIQEFLSRRAGTGARAIAIEPDPANCDALRARLDRLGVGAPVTVHNVGAASQAGRLAFNATGTAGSAITESGSTSVPCARLDDLLESESPTYLKMDIEGAELDALKGASNVIRRCRPVLAICLYHKPEDLWEIPSYIDSLGCGYSYLLRAHAEECWELVMYAIPPERLKGGLTNAA